MSNPAALQSAEYEAENANAFAEDVTTFATLRLPTIGPIDLTGMQQAKIDPDRTAQYRNEGSQWLLAGFGGTFKTDMFLCGHGSATTGATSVSAFETLLGIIFGNAVVSAAAGTTFTGGTASAPTTTASGTFSAGSLCFGGVLGDGRVNGQALAIGTHSTTTLNLLTDAPAAPSNADVLYSGTMIYPSETPTTTTVASVRMRLLSANLRYETHGVVPTAISLSGFNPGEFPRISVTWAPSWWRMTTATFPSTVATDSTNPGVTAAGSLFVADVGTTTRTARTYHNLSIDYTLGIERIMGPGGVNAFQTCVQARRTVDKIKWTWTETADAATTTPVLPGFGTATTSKHALLTCSTAPTSRIAIYSPKLCISNVAVQHADQNLNRLTIEAMAYTGGTTTSDLTLSALRMLFA